jgi:D-galactose 1-dehydrogenase
MTIRVALIGFGKIAKDEHLPAIMANPDFELVAIVSHSAPADPPAPFFPSVAGLFAAMPDGVDAVSVCTPPEPRFDIAKETIAAGVPTLLEKPPTGTIGELDELIELAEMNNVPLFTAWHSQFAAGIDAAAEALKHESVKSLSIVWCEDVRTYHAGQQWIWEAGGFGVFDPGINGLSIATRIIGEPLLVNEATLIFPGNRQAPIAADIVFRGKNQTAKMDWRGCAGEQWSINIETRSGKTIDLTQGGARLAIDGAAQALPPQDEYRAIYQQFAKLVKGQRSLVDREPLRIVADCFLVGKREIGEDFV